MTVRGHFERIRESTWLRACEHVGERTRFNGRPCIDVYGGAISIGSRCTLSSRPVTSHFVAGPSAVLQIGDDVSIGHGGAVAAFERVEIGSGTQIGPFVIIMDTNFHGRPGEQSVQHDCRPVIIGRNCCIGSRVTITRGASIGDGAEILAGSVVSSAVPSGACAAGARARVIGRARQPDSRWESARALIPILTMDALNLAVVPEIDVALSDIPGWDVESSDRLSSDIEAHFGVVIDLASISVAARVGDIAVAVDQARRELTRWSK